MLDNWTTAQLWKFIEQNGIDDTAGIIGRVAITDNEELEKTWDRFVQSRNDLYEQFGRWLFAKDGYAKSA